MADNIDNLVVGMNKLIGEKPLKTALVARIIVARDREMNNTFTKNLLVTAMRGVQHYVGDKLIRVVSPHKITDPKNGSLIAVRLNILRRKTLGDLQIDLSSRVLNDAGESLPGLYATGEVSGFGGGVFVDTVQWKVHF